MSYTKQTWQSGDIITAQKMNHIEDGVAASGGGGGLALYGPYYAESSSSKTIEAGHTLDISLNDVTNYDRDTLSAPSGRYTAFLIGVYGLNTGFTNPKLLSFTAPYYESQYMHSAQVSIANDGNTDITLYPNSYGVVFYSDVEFTPIITEPA